jgi:hypothetical protein
LAKPFDTGENGTGVSDHGFSIFLSLEAWKKREAACSALAVAKLTMALLKVCSSASSASGNWREPLQVKTGRGWTTVASSPSHHPLRSWLDPSKEKGGLLLYTYCHDGDGFT